jgi:hypothetical protein
LIREIVPIVETIQNGYLNSRSTALYLANERWRKDEKLPIDTYGWASPGPDGRGYIALMPDYFDLSDEDRAAALFHELSHYYAGTTDSTDLDKNGVYIIRNNNGSIGIRSGVLKTWKNAINNADYLSALIILNSDGNKRCVKAND